MEKHRFLRYVLVILVLTLGIAGCSGKKQEEDNADSIMKESDNPFEMNEEDTAIMGSIGHGFLNPKIDENDEMVPIEYNGGEIEIEYSVNASGKAKNVGFIVFLNGYPQPYKLNTADAPYQFMHIFDVEEDNMDTPFTFIFTPVTGKKGDRMELTITSVYNPAFIPDMKDTTSYGGYHETLMVSNSLTFNKDADGLDGSITPKHDLLRNIEISTEPITAELLERHSGMQEVNLDTLEKQVLSEVYFDGQSTMKLDNFQVKDSGTLHITFHLFGHPGVKYRNAIFINHQVLMSEEGETSFETELVKGEIAVIDMEIDLDRLEDLSTFYIVSVPINAKDFPEDVITLEKTRSLLLYK